MQPSCHLRLPPGAPSLGLSSSMSDFSGLPSLATKVPSLSSLPSLTSNLLSLTSSLPSLATNLPSLASNVPSLANIVPSLSGLPSSLPGSWSSLGGQEEEKQLFEKFWKGTFKAVATPRPESVIVASITARRRVTSIEASACQAVRGDERKGEEAESRVVLVSDRNTCLPRKRRKHGSRRHTRSESLDDDFSPCPASKGKKKRRKSERKKRRRKRSPSYSLSPQRKKKKKKKKSSKRSKRHRYSSRKTKHSSSSLKRKRRDDRKHKKSSRGHSHRRRRYRRSESESSAWRSSSAESRHRLHKSVRRGVLEQLVAQRQDEAASLEQRSLGWGPVATAVCTTAPNYRSIAATSTIVPSKPGDDILNAKRVHRHHTSPTSRTGPQDYDSGNDTSSPPSTKAGVSQTIGISDQRPLCPVLATPEKLRFAEDVSDSGNSVTSYASLCKPLPVDGGVPASVLNAIGKREQMTSRCRVEVARPQQSALSLPRAVETSRRRKRARSSSSRSRSRSSRRSRHSGRYSSSRSPSSRRFYSRSPSYVSSSWRKGSVGSTSSRDSYPRFSPLRVERVSPSAKGKEVKNNQKGNGKRRGGRSYSPMRKRRRDSPSHLEARRITSARKRPIPYFRPSPSSSSRSTSVSSWSSLFTRSRSHSPVHSLSRSRSRSHSFSSYRSYSRSSSWNSIFGVRSQSRCRSYISPEKHSKARH